MHERQEIRAAVIAALTGETAAGTRVEASRFEPAETDQLPAICVYTVDESVDPDGIMTSPGREITRKLKVAVDGYAAVPANGAIDDTLDALALEIETAMDADVYFGRTAGDSILDNTEIIIDPSGERPFGVVHMVYEFVYRTDLRLPAIEDTAETVGVTYVTVDGETEIHEDNQANDLITLET